jgi:hypothetical protein
MAYNIGAGQLAESLLELEKASKSSNCLVQFTCAEQEFMKIMDHLQPHDHEDIKAVS